MNPTLTEEQKANPAGTLGQIKSRALELRQVEPTVTAGQLVDAPRAPQLTLPEQPSIPERVAGTVNNVRNNVASTLQRAQTAQEDAALFGDLGTIRSQSETAQEVDRLRGDFQQFAQNTSGFDIQNEQLERFGVTPERLQELADIELQLADRATESALTQTRITGAAGQTMAQAQREVTQQDRESAVLNAGLAARAAVLTNNIETGRRLAQDAVNIALQDRTFRANAALQQINDLKEVVSEEQRQLLEQEQRQYESELATIKELKDTVATAIVSDASQQEIATMNDPNTSDADKLALARQVIARNASEEIDLDRQAQRADIAQGWANLDLRQQEVDLSRQRLNSELSSTGNQYGTLDGKAQTSAQSLVNGYADRMIQAEQLISSVGSLFTGRRSLVGEQLPNFMQSAERQQFEQAKGNFINAVLRRESGAAIAPTEFTSAEKQYFPQPGDTEEVLEQKEANRNTVINSFYREANVPRPVFPGDIIESDGKQYRVESDGITITPLK